MWLLFGALWINWYERWWDILFVPWKCKVCHFLSLIHSRSNIYATETIFQRTYFFILNIWGWEARGQNKVHNLITILSFAAKHFVLIFFVILRDKLLILLIEQYFTTLHFLDHFSVFHLILKSFLFEHFLKVLGQYAVFTL